MSKRSFSEIMWGEINEPVKQEKRVLLLDEHFVYTMGNEIHFTTGVNRTSIQALIKQIMDLIMEHKKKAMGEPEKLDIVLQSKYPNLTYKIIVILVCRNCFDPNKVYTSESSRIEIHNIASDKADDHKFDNLCRTIFGV